jgi:excisionase family DNA binding protein
VTDSAHLDSLVGSWLTLPDVAERLGIDVGKVRRLLQEGRIVAVRRGDPRVISVPEDFFVPSHLANPSAPNRAVEGDAGAPALTVLAALQGTFTLLSDAGFDDDSAIEWLFTVDDGLAMTPIEALRTGHKTAVRRQAQALL